MGAIDAEEVTLVILYNFGEESVEFFEEVGEVILENGHPRYSTRVSCYDGPRTHTHRHPGISTYLRNVSKCSEVISSLTKYSNANGPMVQL